MGKIKDRYAVLLDEGRDCEAAHIAAHEINRMLSEGDRDKISRLLTDLEYCARFYEIKLEFEEAVLSGTEEPFDPQDVGTMAQREKIIRIYKRQVEEIKLNIGKCKFFLEMNHAGTHLAQKEGKIIRKKLEATPELIENALKKDQSFARWHKAFDETEVNALIKEGDSEKISRFFVELEGLTELHVSFAETCEGKLDGYSDDVEALTPEQLNRYEEVLSITKAFNIQAQAAIKKLKDWLKQHEALKYLSSESLM